MCLHHASTLKYVDIAPVNCNISVLFQFGAGLFVVVTCLSPSALVIWVGIDDYRGGKNKYFTLRLQLGLEWELVSTGDKHDAHPAASRTRFGLRTGRNGLN